MGWKAFLGVEGGRRWKAFWGMEGFFRGWKAFWGVRISAFNLKTKGGLQSFSEKPRKKRVLIILRVYLECGRER